MRMMTLAMIMMACSSCLVYKPYYRVYYKNLEMPSHNAYPLWTFEDEVQFMRGKRTDDGRRDTAIVQEYYVGGALCDTWIRAGNQTGGFGGESSNPYWIFMTVTGKPDEHISFTIKQISVTPQGGDDFSDLANRGLPKTVDFKKVYDHKFLGVWDRRSHYEETDEIRHFYGVFQTDKGFYFKEDSLTVTVTLEIERVDGTVTGNVVSEFFPVVDKGKFQVWAPW
ncbi:MAG: hypothetical protein LBH44_04515 [Treponema sp.]|nr:hypothetical protein [Treponema sp.]